ncbi:MAG: glycosyltransferase family 4 protein [Firmicutes bacterium]|nr:glycosyltransferase family 4 protein [Bacillota bacterium]
MKIAEVTATFPPYQAGSGNVAYHNARLLSERGHEVTVFTQRPRVPFPDDRKPFETRYLTPLLTVGNAPFLPGLGAALRGFDLIHLHYPFIFGTEMTLVAARRYGIPLLLTYHNRLWAESGLKAWLFSGYNAVIEPWALRRAARVIAVSRDHLKALFPGLHAVEVPNGVSTDLFKPYDAAACRRVLNLPPDQFLGLFVGALDAAHPFKNLSALLRAWTRLSHGLLLVVGDGPLRPAFEREAQKLGLRDRVRFEGGADHQRLPWYYSAADVTVLPSRNTESFGMVLVESMACQTPVVATNLPGVRQVVQHRETGLLIPVDDEALFQALAWMAEHPRERARMGRQGRQWVERHYAWPIVGQKLEEACLEALAASVHTGRRLAPKGRQAPP